MFKEILDKLSISSKEAVVDGNLNSFDEFKNYLHIDRYVERKLEQIILSATKSSRSQLILISGNVGDGKSHMMSRLYQNYPAEMASIEVRNDATESNDVNKSWIDELNDFLFPFKDDQLEKSSKKVTRIVAINLGVLSTFLDKSGEEFSRLETYVSERGIIGSLSFDNEYNADSFFQYINLADYNLFTLKKDSVSSKLIKQLLVKITSKEQQNPFYKAFEEYYTAHPNKIGCPMRSNFLQLGKENVQDGLANIIVYGIIKFKLIISIRDLLNFIYDLIVPNEFSNLSGAQIKERVKSLNSVSILNHSIFNKLFDSVGRSEIFSNLKKLDPIKFRSQFLDELIFKINSTDSPNSIFKEYNLDISDEWNLGPLDYETKGLLIKTFIRALFLNDIQKFENELAHFHKFSKYLFAYFKGDKNGLKTLYKEFIKAIYCWNGSSNNDEEISVHLGRRQLQYVVSQKISLTPSIQTYNNPNKVDEVHEFDTSILVGIKAGENEIHFTLDIDLYVLLQNVLQGYSPNKLDRENHTNFQQSVDKITILSSRNKSINFEQVNGSLRQRFQLNFDNDFGYEFIKK